MNLLIFYDSKASLCGGAERGIFAQQFPAQVDYSC